MPTATRLAAGDVELWFGDAETPVPPDPPDTTSRPSFTVAVVGARAGDQVVVRYRVEDRDGEIRLERARAARTPDGRAVTLLSGELSGLRHGAEVSYAILLERRTPRGIVRLPEELQGGQNPYHFVFASQGARMGSRDRNVPRTVAVASADEGGSSADSSTGRTAAGVATPPGVPTVASTADVSGVTRPPTAARVVTPPAAVGVVSPAVATAAARPAIASKVSGTIAVQYGAPAAKVKVRLYQRGFGGTKTLLGETITDERGRYEIPYMAAGAANIEVHAVGASGEEVQLSRTKFGAGTDETVNLVAPAKLQPAASEFSRLRAAVAPQLGNDPTALKDAVERGPRRDISVLAAATAWDGRALALAAIAYENADTTQIPAEALYALYRAGLPTEARSLARVSQNSIVTTLAQAAQAGIIDAPMATAGGKAFADFAATQRLKFTAPGKLSSVAEFIAKAPVSATDRAAFTAVMKEGKPDNLWARAKAAGASDQGIEALKLQGKLGYLTLNNAELAASLQDQLGTKDVRALIDLDFDRPASWRDKISSLAGNDAAQLTKLIPPAFRGAEAQDRLGAYADELARRVRQMDPNRVTMRRLARGDIDAVPPAARRGVETFLGAASAKGFRLGQTGMSSFVAKHGADALMPGLNGAEKKAALSDIKSLHRMYSLSTSDEALNALLKLGFKSAYDITRLTYDQFVIIAGSAIGATRELRQIYWKAQQQSATIVNVFAGAKQLGTAPPMLGTSPPPEKRADQIAKAQETLVGRYPTLEALFGSVDYCECAHCKSVLSPAAYLVDILHFLDPKETQWGFTKALWAAAQPTPGAVYPHEKPYEALVTRRRDIPKIRLTCENTNTALPYIDIVNEILELLAAVGPSNITAFDTGAASSEDLIAEPQNITWEAYIGTATSPGLKGSVYPTLLPFDLPLEMVRAFLAKLELPLWKLRETVGRPTTLRASTGKADGYEDVWFERIGLGAADISALTGGHPWYALYGYANQNAALAALTNAKTLSRRLGVTYKELVELLKTGFINPSVGSLIVLRKLDVDPHDIDRYFDPAAATPLTATERSAFEARLATAGLTPAMIQPLWTASVRESLLLLRSPEVGCDFSSTTLAFAKSPADVGAAMSLALLKLTFFVRLQRKLRWTTQLLDTALQVFVQPNVAALTMAKWPSAIRTALIYLAHLQEIVDRTEGKAAHEELLVLWAPIPTTGIANLYERLFLNRGVLALDPVFDNTLGHYLVGSTEPLSAHVDAIRQALQVSSEDIGQIFASAGITSPLLSIANLSIVMRYKVLATALGISIPDLAVYLALTRTKPLSPLSADPIETDADLEKDVPFSGTIAFIREVERLRDAGLSAEALEGVVRYRGPSIDTGSPDDLGDRLLAALSALPRQDAATTDAEALKRERLGAVQTLAAQMGAAEPLVGTLVTAVLTDPGTGATLLDALRSLRTRPLDATGTTWSSYVWFPASGTYKVVIPDGSTGVLKFGAGDTPPAIPLAGREFELKDVRAGERYRFELTLGAAGRVSIEGNAGPLSIPVADHARLVTAVARLRRALDVLGALGITAAELDYIRAIPGALSLDSLPLAPVTDESAAKTTLAGLSPWVEVVAARNTYGADDRVVLLLRAARRTYGTAGQQAAFDADLASALTALTAWKPEFIRALRAALSLTTVETSVGSSWMLEVPELATPAGLRRVTDAAAALIRLGLNPDDVVMWSRKPVDLTAATKVRAALKGRYSRSAWRNVARPVFDVLRKQQRDALVAYLTHLDGAPYGETLEQLFESLLLDPGTEPPVLASRIQLAISSVQLFVQRCLMNMEKDVAPSIIDAERWEWMRRYRVWEVNRKMFLWPENWLQPEFRDDKTHLFRDLEGALLQGDVSEDLVRTALHTYLKGLESIARLEMMTMYFEPGASPDASTIHVIARTPNAPHKYFYRQCSHMMWTPWEPLDVEIEGEHLVLTVWRARMHLFWVTFFEKAEEGGTPKKDSGGDKTFGEIGDGSSPGEVKSKRVVQLQLNWVEQVQGKWTNQSSTQTFLDAKEFGDVRASDPESKRNFSVHVTISAQNPDEVGDDILDLHVSRTDGKAQKFRLFSKLAPPQLKKTGSQPPSVPMTVTSRLATKWAGDAPLAVTFTAEDTKKDGETTSTSSDAFEILTQGGEFRLLFPSNEIRLDLEQTIPLAAGRASGYVFAPQGAQHVVYRGLDSSIHDVWWTPNGWFHTNASAAAGPEAEPATGDPHGYPLDEQHLHAIAYIAERKVLELSWSQLDALGADADADVATGWRVETVFEAAASTPAPVGRPLGGMFTPKRGVVYRTAGGALWAAVEGATPGSWQPPTRLNTGATPAAASDPAGLLMTATTLGVTTVKSRHIFYRGADGNLHELRSDASGAVWTHTNLTSATSSPLPAPNATPAAYGFQTQGTLHVVYRAADGTVHELWGTVGSWRHNPIGAPYGKAKGDPSGYVTEFAGTQHVVYRGTDNHVRELWWDTSGWHENVLTQAIKAPIAVGDPTGYAFERYKTQHVVYRAPGGRLRELWWDVGGWHRGTYELASPFADPIAPLIAPFFYEDQEAPHTFFVEPTLAEKTVHDWNEYVVTTEEYVEDAVFVPVEFTPHFPEKLPIDISEDALLPPDLLPPDTLLGDGLVLVTNRGAFDAHGGVRGGAMPGSVTPEATPARAETGSRVRNAARGATRNTRMRGGTNGGRFGGER